MFGAASDCGIYVENCGPLHIYAPPRWGSTSRGLQAIVLESFDLPGFLIAGRSV